MKQQISNKRNFTVALLITALMSSGLYMYGNDELIQQTPATQGPSVQAVWKRPTPRRGPVIMRRGPVPVNREPEQIPATPINDQQVEQQVEQPPVTKPEEVVSQQKEDPSLMLTEKL